MGRMTLRRYSRSKEVNERKDPHEKVRPSSILGRGANAETISVNELTVF